MAAFLAVVSPVAAADDTATLAQLDLTDLSIEDLLEIEVVTVSKKAEPLFQAPAPVYVISGNEIRRSGARSLPDILRLAPGVEVAQTGSRAAAVTVRGFNETSADKLEVLVDGRSVYTPLTSAVFWEMLDTMLPDIDRIEVVRGPGGTVWGANAVNGVINIVTKSSFDTTGDLAVVGGGSETTGSAGLRMGRLIGKRGAIRMYALARDLDGTIDREENDRVDSLRHVQGGFRTDWNLREASSLSISMDLYAMRSGFESFGDGGTVEDDRDGGNLNLRWNRRMGENGELSLTSFVDWYRIDIPGLFDENRQTYDIDLRYRLDWGRHELTFGAGFRQSEDDTTGPPIAIFVDPLSRTLKRPSAFLQDRISFADGKVSLTLGSKFEDNDLTGTEVQPSARLGWLLSEDSFVALSVARAVRTPNRFDEDVALFCSDGLASVGFCEAGGNFRIGNPDLESEQLTAVDVILRHKFNDRVSAELTLFQNDYSDLISTEPNPPPFGSFANQLEGESRGGELAVNGTLRRDLGVRAWVSFLDLEIDDSRSMDDGARASIEGSSPEFQASVALRWSPGHWEVDAIGRHVDGMRYENSDGEPQIAEAYTELDLRIARRFAHGLTASLIGRNLADEAHAELPSSDAQMERAVFLELVWQPDAAE